MALNVCGNFFLAVGVTPALMHSEMMHVHNAAEAYAAVQLKKYDPTTLGELAYPVDIIELDSPATNADSIYDKLREAINNRLPPINVRIGRVPDHFAIEYHPFIYEPSSGLWVRLDSHFKKNFIVGAIPNVAAILRDPVIQE